MMRMVEESPESFISRWRHHAAEVELFAHTEGSPMLECKAGDAIIQVFERTGPYLSRPGPARVIVNPVVEGVAVLDDAAAAQQHVESVGVSRLKVTGTVLERDGRVLVLDAGVPLVVSSLSELPAGAVVGATVDVSSIAPVHAFVVGHGVMGTRTGSHGQRRHEAHDELL